MNNGLISVIIPVYNVEKYLSECLNSILNQTYKNIEIIAINDGSKDESFKILKKYAITSENIVILSQENSGQSVARNKGLEIAKGEYIYFLDADDYILPETFEHLMGKMQKNNLDLIRFSAEPFADEVDIKINKKQYDFDVYFDQNKLYRKEEFLKLNLLAYSPSPVLYLVRKEVLTTNKIIFKPGIVHEDDLFNVKVFLNINRAMYSPLPYYKRRFRPNSTMTTKSYNRRKNSFDSRCIILKEFNNMLVQHTDENEVNLIRKRIHYLIATLIYNYDDIDKNHRKNKMKDIRRISFCYYYYYYLRKKISKPMKKLLNK